MSYILAVNPNMISETGIPVGAAFMATALGAAIATVVMALIANIPVSLAPGMGVNAFFTYTIVGGTFLAATGSQSAAWGNWLYMARSIGDFVSRRTYFRRDIIYAAS